MAVAVEKASSDVPKDKSDSGSSEKAEEKIPCGDSGPRATDHSGEDVPLGGTALVEGPSSACGFVTLQRV